MVVGDRAGSPGGVETNDHGVVARIVVVIVVTVVVVVATTVGVLSLGIPC